MHARKLIVLLAAVVIIFAVFLLYLKFSGAPPVDEVNTEETTQKIPDPNFPHGGRVGDAEPGVVQNAKYVHLDENKNVDREFGFEKLLYKERDLWHTKKPYMNIYKPNFECRITADTGTTEIASVANKVIPKDSSFSGNVVIHIMPTAGSEIQESYVYLDDIEFVSERSLFSTAGPVRFESDEVELTGQGLELIYNEAEEQVKFIHIKRLKELCLNRTEPKSESKEKQKSDEGTGGKKTRLRKSKTSHSRTHEETTETPQKEPSTETNYMCIFQDNVLMETPEHLIFAKEEVLITEIPWRRNSGGESPETGRNKKRTSSRKPESKTKKQLAKNIDESGNSTKSADKAKKSQQDKDARPEKSTSRRSGSQHPFEDPLGNVTVTCDGGLVMAPMDSTERIDELEDKSQPPPPAPEKARLLEKANDRNVLFARALEYEMKEDDEKVTAQGPVESLFYAQEQDSPDSQKYTLMPVKVSAERKAVFRRRENQIVFVGDCFATMTRKQDDGFYTYTLSAPLFVANLMPASSKRFDFSLRKFVARDGLVTLTISRAGQSLAKTTRDIASKKKIHTLDIDETNSTVITAGRFIYHGRSENAFAVENVKLNFTLQDFVTTEPNQQPIPVEVVCSDRASFRSDSNQVLFEGDVKATMLRKAGDDSQRYIISGPRFTLDLSEDRKIQSAGGAVAIKHFTADKGTVRLSREDLGDKPGGDVELKCTKFDYDSRSQCYVATGPGTLTADNSRVPPPEEETSRFSLDRPCYALLSNFSKLSFFSVLNQIITESAPDDVLNIDYIPVGEKQEYGRTWLTAGHAQVELFETSTNQLELGKLSASDGIFYEDSKYQFAGTEMLFDANEATIKAWGKKGEPCLLNGQIVDAVQYDLEENNAFEVEVAAPGIMQMER